MTIFCGTMLLRRVPGSAQTFFGLFAIISVLVVLGVTQHGDLVGIEATATLRRPALTHAMQALSGIGNWWAEVPLAAAIFGWFHYRKRTASGWRFLAIGASGEALYALTKLAFHRPRPNVVAHLSGAGWYSYPSGHAMMAVILWGFGLMLVADSVQSRLARWVLRVVAVALPVGIAASRIYLGVHYPSDVLGGVCLSMAWVLLWRERSSGTSVPATSSAPATR